MSPTKKKTPTLKKRFQTKTEETAHYNAVLIEDLRDQFKFVTEAVSGLQESIPQQMNAMEARLEQKIDDTREGLGMRIDKLDGKVDKLDGRMDKLDGRMDKLDGRMDKLDGRMDKLDGRMDKLDGRMDKLDGRMDKLETKVDDMASDLGGKIDGIHEILTRHEGEIQTIKSRVA